MGREILVFERNWETIHRRRVHSVELHSECSCLHITGGLNGKCDIGG